MDLRSFRQRLDELYARYNQRAFVPPDPLQFLYGYSNSGDQELVGLLCALLAYGRVGSILNSLEKCLKPLGPHPREVVLGTEKGGLDQMFRGFCHRFHKGADLALILSNAKGLIEAHGGLGQALKAFFDREDMVFLRAVSRFIGGLSRGAERPLLPDPAKGSAAKRTWLYLRWMVRRDEVDPGCWNGLFSPKELLVPLDTHLFRISRRLGFTRRRSPDIRAVEDITRKMAQLNPEDPVKYDFVLTRFGINPRFQREELFCFLNRSS